MSNRETFLVTDESGAQGVVDLSIPLSQGESGHLISVVPTGGQRILVPEALLTRREDNSYFLATTFAEAQKPTPAGALREVGDIVIPVVEEQLQITKHEVETGRIRLTKTVNEREETFDEPLSQEEINVERVTVNRLIEGSLPEARYEGETMIIPLFEEVVVMEKKIILKEELRITKKRFETRSPRSVVLRNEEVNIERLP
jgi:uncharacterized protein (TIGR02271 family)